MTKAGDRRDGMPDLTAFIQPSTRRSTVQLGISVMLFIGTWVLAYRSLSWSTGLSFLFMLAAAGFLVRLFVIFHDCCHRSLFSKRLVNEIVGIGLGYVTFFPYHQWRREHALHHAGSGNLARRGDGDIWTLTVDECQTLSTSRRLWYRVYRNPLVMFGLGPIPLFLWNYRRNRMGADRRERVNTWATNAMLPTAVGLLGWVLDPGRVFLVEGMILYLSGVMGIFLFYVQHQFDGAYFENPEAWDPVSAAVRGSSYYKLPRVLQWLTANIGLHHVHHLSVRIPNYNLQRAHDSVQLLREVRPIGVRESLRSLRYRAWDPVGRCLVSFDGVRQPSHYSREGGDILR